MATWLTPPVCRPGTRVLELPGLLQEAGKSSGRRPTVSRQQTKTLITDCGMLTFKDEELRNNLEQSTGTAAGTPAHFHAFSDLEENVRNQVQKVRSHPWVPKDIPVRGFIFDVKTGRLNEVSA